MLSTPIDVGGLIVLLNVVAKCQTNRHVSTRLVPKLLQLHDKSAILQEPDE